MDKIITEENYKSKIITEEPGKPTLIEVQPGCSAIIFNENGSIDLGLLPEASNLKSINDSDDFEANEGMIRFMAVILAATDKDVRNLVEKKLELLEKNV